MAKTATEVGIYKVVPWTSGTYAIVDIEKYKDSTDESKALIMLDSNIELLEAIAHKLNGRYYEALSTNYYRDNTIELDEEHMTMLNRVSEGMTREVEKSWQDHPLISVLREAVKETGDPNMVQALKEAESEVNVKDQVTKEAILQQFIKKLYLDGIKKGVVKP